MIITVVNNPVDTGYKSGNNDVSFGYLVSLTTLKSE